MCLEFEKKTVIILPWLLCFVGDALCCVVLCCVLKPTKAEEEHSGSSDEEDESFSISHTCLLHLFILQHEIKTY